MSGEPDSATIQVLDVQPGWIVVHFKVGDPSPDRRFHLLHQAVLNWLSSHLHCRLQNIQPVHEQGALRGLNVFYSVGTPPPSGLSIEVDAEIARQYGSEYLEAVVADAVKILLSNPQSPANFAIINRRHVAVVIDRRRDWAYVLHVEKIESAMPSDSRDRLRDWLIHPHTHHYVMELPEGFKPWESPPV